MYLIKGLGFILIVNCLLHPLFIANISGALCTSNDFFFPLFQHQFQQWQRIRIYMWLILWLTLCDVIELRMGKWGHFGVTVLVQFSRGAHKDTHARIKTTSWTKPTYRQSMARVNKTSWFCHLSRQNQPIAKTNQSQKYGESEKEELVLSFITPHR